MNNHKYKKWGAYDGWWKNYTSVNAEEPGTKYRKKLILEKITKYKERETKWSVLDCGCGAGELIDFLKANIKQSVFSGSDISQFIIDENKKRFDRDNFFILDLEKKHNSKVQYDMVINSEVIEHVFNWKNGIYTLAGLVKKGGFLMVTTQSGHRYGHHLELGHTKHFTLSELTQELEKYGFTLVEGFNCGWPFMNLKNVITNFPFFNVRQSVMKAQKQSFINRAVFVVFYYLYLVSLKFAGPQLFLLVKKNEK